MRQAVRLWTGLALALLLPIGVWAQTETLTKGLQQLERQEYAAARETLASVDRSRLNDAEKAELEEALKALDAAQPKAQPEAAPRADAAPAAQPERLTPVDEMRLRDDLIWQRAVARMQDLAGKARQAVATGNFIEARTLAEQALQQIEAARSYAEPVSRYEDARNAALNLRREVEDAAARAEADAAAREQAEIAAAIRTRQQLQEAARKEKIEQLFASAAQLRKEQRFNEAAEALRQIVYIDPGNARARELMDVAEDYASYMQQKDWHNDLNFQQRRSLVNADEALIPWDYEVLYPRNWQELVARRSTSGQLVVGQSPQDSELNRKLDEILSDVSLQEEPLERAIASLTQGKLNISVDWDDLAGAGIERDRTVSLRVTNLSLKTVLNEVLLQAGGNVKLAFAVADGLLRIATKEKLDRDKFVLVYDIRDLLLNIPKFVNANLLDPVQAMNIAERPGSSRGDVIGAGSLFNSAAAAEDAREHDRKAVEIVSGVMDIIRTTVEPDSWRESSGGDASMRELNGQLIVYQTSDAHRQVKDLLHQLRETQALQIAMEARYLSVTSNFLEEIGVDIDFVFNQGSADFDRATNAAGAVLTDPSTGAPILIPRQASRGGFLPSVPPVGTPFPQTTPLQPYTAAGLVPTGTGVSPHFNDMTPISVGQNSLGLTNPRTLNTQVPGSLAEAVGNSPALNIAGSFLDNLQVDFLIRATQANRRSSIVQAPRLMMFNGQRANITVGRARTYVSSLFPILAEGAVGFQPVLQAAQSGVVLDVEGTISADRKYVTVTVRSSQAEEPSFERFEVQRASGNSPGAFITLLDQRFTTISTTVSIPDGGTVLLGGLKQVGEVEVDAGVPILSKIPVLKRAFTNTTQIKDTRTLLILLKTKIVIQRETEEEAFPTLGAAAN